MRVLVFTFIRDGDIIYSLYLNKDGEFEFYDSREVYMATYNLNNLIQYCKVNEKCIEWKL